MAAGQRTAPNPDTAPLTKQLVTLHLIDASGDLYAQTFTNVAAVAPADVQTLATEYAALTQASLYKITICSEWEGDIDPQNAVAGDRSSVKQGINLLYNSVSLDKSTTPRLIAPDGSVMQGNQDIPFLTAAANLIAAIKAVIGPSYELTSGQYTERRERNNNPRIRA